MSQQVCLSCRKPKATLHCEICHESVCKNCVQFLEASSFSFMKEVPPELSHSSYCAPCFDSIVVPEQEAYQDLMARAKEIYVFFTTQRKAVPVLKKSKEQVRVETCDDRDETILRLAFLAVSDGYNALLETEVISEKVRDHGYQKSKWSGKAVPVQVDEAKVRRSAFGPDSE